MGLSRDGLIACGLCDRRRIKTQPQLSMQRCFNCPRAGPRIARAFHAAARANRKKGREKCGPALQHLRSGGYRSLGSRWHIPLHLPWGSGGVSSSCITRAAAATVTCHWHINVILQLWQRRRAGAAQLQPLTHPMCPQHIGHVSVLPHKGPVQRSVSPGCSAVR